MFFFGHWVSPNIHKFIIIPVVFRYYFLIIAYLLFYLRNKPVSWSIITLFSWNRKDQYCFYIDPFRKVFIREHRSLCGEFTRHFGYLYHNLPTSPSEDICIIISSEGNVGRFMLSENCSEVFSDLCSLIIRPVVIQRTPALLSNKFHLHLKYSPPFPQMRYYPSGMAAIQELSESESRSVMSDSLWPRVYSPWNSPGQNTGVGSLSLFQGIFPTQGSNPGFLHCRRILYQLCHRSYKVKSRKWHMYTLLYVK